MIARLGKKFTIKAQQILDLPIRKRKLRKSGKKRHTAQRKMRNLRYLQTILCNAHLCYFGWLCKTERNIAYKVTFLRNDGADHALGLVI